MQTMIDIKIQDLILGFSILIIPFLIFSYYKVRLNRDLIVSVIRMVVQLFLVALYLEWIFEINSAWINSLWVLIMIIVGGGTVVERVGISWKQFLFPFILAGFVSMTIIDGFFLGFVIKTDYFFDARYFVPISGMVLGNSLNHNIVGLTAFFKGLSRDKELYNFLLTNSGSSRLALRPFIQGALIESLNPLLATMSVIGLISLPGMMTGQILGGASPAVAIKYQVMIMLAIFVGCTLTLVLSILFSKRLVFDEMGNVKGAP
ncbi:ABC transporter permease [Marinilabilia sp.]|uniref:ABC transporter permease n=1 Tax=Marinilabilia sp. TaxID=2021252 RepID=UPI0025C6BD6A|nr:ABC transporter permease [Marinilabilia sp.]